MAVLGVALSWSVVGWSQSAPASPPKQSAPVTKKDSAKKKAEEMGKIEGMTIPRGTGFLGVQLVGGAFKLTAYDAKKKPVAADFTRVALRWNVNYQPNPERTLLTPSGSLGVFSSGKIVKPPHSFRLFVTLIKGETDDAPVENLTVDFQG